MLTNTELKEMIAQVWGEEFSEDANENDFIFYDDVFTDKDLGLYLIEVSGMYDTDSMGMLAYYIDYESFGRDYRFEADGGYAHTFDCKHCGWLEYIG